MTTAVATVVTPLEVDELAKEYLALKDKVQEATLAAKAAQAPLDAKAEELKQLIGEFGSAYAEKSKLLRAEKPLAAVWTADRLTQGSFPSLGEAVNIDGAKECEIVPAKIEGLCENTLHNAFPVGSDSVRTDSDPAGRDAC